MVTFTSPYDACVCTNWLTRPAAIELHDARGARRCCTPTPWTGDFMLRCRGIRLAIDVTMPERDRRRLLA